MKSNRLLNFVMTISLCVGIAFAADYIVRECFFKSEDETLVINEASEFSADEVDNLSVYLFKADLIIKSGEKLTLSTDSGYITYSLKKSKLVVSEMTHSLKKSNGTVILTIPNGKQFAKFYINAGKGNIQAETISSQSLDIDCGVGDIEINNLLTESKSKIDGGSGSVKILNGKLNNTEIDVGVGNITVKAKLSGETNIECGVGKIELTLLGSEDLYSFDIDKGVGTVIINGKSVGDGKYGYGGNNIEIDGGVGSVNISFE